MRSETQTGNLIKAPTVAVPQSQMAPIGGKRGEKQQGSVHQRLQSYHKNECYAATIYKGTSNNSIIILLLSKRNEDDYTSRNRARPLTKIHGQIDLVPPLLQMPIGATHLLLAPPTLMVRQPILLSPTAMQHFFLSNLLELPPVPTPLLPLQMPSSRAGPAYIGSPNPKRSLLSTL